MPLVSRRIFVRGLKVEAAIGIYDHELGRTQPLTIDAIISIGCHEIQSLKDTLNYELVGKIARDFIARGHIKLVETFAEDLAHALLAIDRVEHVEVTINKPEALKDADQAGCIVIFERSKD